MNISLASLCGILCLLVAGCAAPEPRFSTIHSAGGIVDGVNETRGYVSSTQEYPEGDYRNVLSNPGPF